MADNQHDATADFNEALKAAFDQGKYDELAVFYTADTVLLPPRGRMLEGRSLVSAFWRGVKTRFSGMVFTTTGLKALGDTAKRETGTYSTVASDGADGTLDGKYIFVWQLVDGDWQIESSIWNRSGSPGQGNEQGRRGQGDGQRRGSGQGGQLGQGQRRQGAGGQGGGYRQGAGDQGGGYRQGGGGRLPPGRPGWWRLPARRRLPPGRPGRRQTIVPGRRAESAAGGGRRGGGGWRWPAAVAAAKGAVRAVAETSTTRAAASIPILRSSASGPVHVRSTKF